MLVPSFRRRDVNYQNLRDLYVSQGAATLCESLQLGLEIGRKNAGDPAALFADDFSLLELAEATMPGWQRSFPKGRGGYILREEAVDSTAFANITGQIVYSKLMQGWMEADAGLFEKLCTVQQTQFNGEKIPGMSAILDEEFEVAEGAPFEESGFGEHYIETPPTKKFMNGVSVTKETLFFDRTGLVLKQAATVGERLATGRLKRVLKALTGLQATAERYKFDGTAYATYQASTPWINTQSNPLVDWRDVEEAQLMQAAMTHPDTGNPLESSRGIIIVPPAKAMTARQIVNATEIRKGDGAASSNTSPVTVGANPLAGLVDDIIVSPLLKKILVDVGGVSSSNADLYWFWGQPKKALTYMQNWGLTFAQLGDNSHLAWSRGIVAAYKAEERGVCATEEPRWLVRNTN